MPNVDNIAINIAAFSFNSYYELRSSLPFSFTPGFSFPERYSEGMHLPGSNCTSFPLGLLSPDNFDLKFLI
jgi:hypothetical protein